MPSARVIAAAVAVCSAGAPRLAAAAPQLDPTFGVGVEERYDDAFLEAAPGAVQLQTKVTPQVGLWARGHLFDASGWYAADLLYRHSSGSFALDHRGQLRLSGTLSERIVADARVDLWRVSDSTSLPRLGMARALVPVLYGRGNASVQLRMTPRWSAAAVYALEGARIEDGVAAPGWVHAPSLEAWYRLSWTTDLGVEWRMQYFSFGPEQATAHSGIAQLRHRFGPLVTGRLRAGPGVFLRGDQAQASAYPRVIAELGRDSERFDIAVQAGHDLIGASGFTAALWADFASIVADYWFAAPLKLTMAGNYYRNGLAPNEGFWPISGGANAQGYALGAALEWQVNTAVAVRLQADRYAQLAIAPELGGAPERLVVSARAVITPWGTSVRPH